jgi:hypothetical protein
MVTSRIVYRGAKEICGAVGVPWKEIGRYVREKDFPAFKVNGSGTWIALPEDLLEWVRNQRDIAKKRP